MLLTERMQEVESLSAAEQAVASKMAELKCQLNEMTIRDLADAAFTATSAVTRLAKKMGYQGFVEFKTAYLEELHYLDSHFQDLDANLPFLPTDNLARIANSMAQMYQQTSQDTLSLIDYPQLIKAIELLEKAQTIYVLCYGAGQDLAKVFQDRMMRINKKVEVYDNIHKQFYATYNATSQDCFILITYTGTTSKIRTYLDQILKNKARSILITSKSENDLSLLCDAVLRMTTREKLYSNIANFSSTISIMMILDLLYSGLFGRDFDENFDFKKKLGQDYENCRTSITSLMDEE